jgi:hypothetical protein
MRTRTLLLVCMLSATLSPLARASSPGHRVVQPSAATTNSFDAGVCALAWGACVLNTPCITMDPFSVDYDCVASCDQAFDACMGQAYDCPDTVCLSPYAPAVPGRGSPTAVLNSFYFPRFDTGDPGGALQFDLSSGSNTLRVGRWHQDGFATGAGSITQVAFFEVPLESLAVHTLDTAPWTSLGDGTYNAGSDRWEFSYTPVADDPHAGHVFAARCNDTSLKGGTGQAVTLALGNYAQVLGVPVGRDAAHRLRAWPSPLTAGASMTLELVPATTARAIEITLYDISGRLVRHLGVPGGVGAGAPSRVQWDGRDDHGTPVAAAVYFVRATAPEWSSPIRGLVIVRP